jgi:hypothetical protein
VKRHLRRARNGEFAPRQESVPPTAEAVLDVYDSVVRSSRRRAA